MRSKGRLEVVVVGGGIGGLATALALSRKGIAAHVLEQAHEFAEIGAGIQLAPNALRMLDRLGVIEGVYANAVYPPAVAFMDAYTGERIAALEFGDRFRDSYRFPYVVTHRTDLHGSLL